MTTKFHELITLGMKQVEKQAQETVTIAGAIYPCVWTLVKRETEAHESDLVEIASGHCPIRKGLVPEASTPARGSLVIRNGSHSFSVLATWSDTTELRIDVEGRYE